MKNTRLQLRRRVFKRDSLGKIIQNFMARQELPYGFDIRFEHKGRRVRADKVCAWYPLKKLDNDTSVSYLLARFTMRIKGIDFDKVYMVDLKNAPIHGNTYLENVRAMDGLPTREEIVARKIYEEARADIKKKIDMGYDMDAVLDAYLYSLLERYSTREVEDALTRVDDEASFHSS